MALIRRHQVCKNEQCLYWRDKCTNKLACPWKDANNECVLVGHLVDTSGLRYPEKLILQLESQLAGVRP